MTEDIKHAIKIADYNKFVKLIDSLLKITQRDIDALLDEVCTAHLRMETRGYGGAVRRKNISDITEAQAEVKVGRKQFIKPGPTYLMAMHLIAEYGANPRHIKNGKFQSKEKLDLLKRLKVIEE